MVIGKPKDQNSYQGELGGLLEVMCTIEIMESILDSSTLAVNSCDSISALRRETIQPEAVKNIWKQVYFISHLSDVFQSMDSGISLVHVYRHQNNGILASNLTSLAYLSVILYTRAEHIMAEFLFSPEKRNTIPIGLSEPHIISSISIHRYPFHSNIALSIP